MTDPKDTAGEARQDTSQGAPTPSADIIPFRRPATQDAPSPEPDTPDDDGPSAA